ncbi:MAG: alpha/beta fold hydrolase [Desulfobacterales bacterium]|nr:alpha/beta fold hydrolase [Desulfobacterales bacterium]
MKSRNLFKILLISLIAVGIATFTYAGGENPPSYTQTKYPIVLVPGVLGFDKLLGTVAYFYGIEDAIKKDSGGQEVHLISLSGWQETEARGLDLKNKIEELCLKYGYSKVNVIAHSHGSTTSRVAMKLIPHRFASLTTIAGPHYGTPTADCGASMPSILQNAAYSAINLLMGDLVGLISGHPEYVGDQNTAAVLNDFTQGGMKLFNTVKYPCAGVPKGGSYGTKQYGADATAPGAESEVVNGNTIRYYSWTGDVSVLGVTVPTTTVGDVTDVAMTATDALNKLYGYWGPTDAFIPVSSAKFGKFLGTYWWNHADEINQTVGLWVPSSMIAQNPKEVFRIHANRLQQAGL